MPESTLLQLPLIEEQAALAVVAKPPQRTVGALLADAVQFAPPSAGALVPKSSNLRNDLAAEALTAGLLRIVPTLRAIPN
jgi:hypothetical protein